MLTLVTGMAVLMFAGPDEGPRKPSLPPAPAEERYSDLTRPRPQFPEELTAFLKARQPTPPTSPVAPVQAAPTDDVAQQMKKMEERLKALEEENAKLRAGAPAAVAVPSNTPDTEKEIPGWRVRLYPYTPNGEIRFKDFLFTHYYLNSIFDFAMGMNGEEGLRYTYRYEAVFRAFKPGTYVFAFDLRCNKSANISSCFYQTSIDGTVRDSFFGRKLNNRRTVRVEVSQPQELVLDVLFTGAQRTYIQIHQRQFTILAQVRGPDDADYRDFRQAQQPYELFVRVPKDSTLTPSRYQ